MNDNGKPAEASADAAKAADVPPPVQNGANPVDEELIVGETVPAPETGQPDAVKDQQETVAAEPDPVEALITENTELKDRLLRAVAETENLRRRADREKAEATLYAASNFARDILGVADNLSRALEAVSTEDRDSLDKVTAQLVSGIELTERELVNVFKRHGISRIDAKGEKFDPNKHQAMFKVPDASVEPNTVVQVMQPGYSIGERVLRPAMVGVSTAAEAPSGENSGAGGGES